jgi:hypothetical protein
MEGPDARVCVPIRAEEEDGWELEDASSNLRDDRREEGGWGMSYNPPRHVPL